MNTFFAGGRSISHTWSLPRQVIRFMEPHMLSPGVCYTPSYTIDYSVVWCVAHIVQRVGSSYG